MRWWFTLSAAYMLLLAPVAIGQSATWLSDEQAREAATAPIRLVDPRPCYSTYRVERLESFLSSLQRNPIVDGHLNNSIYFYRVASDSCEYVTQENGKTVLHTIVSMDCCEYGIVAVDRVTGKTYRFGGHQDPNETFKEFVRNEQLHPDSDKPVLFGSLYRELVWGNDDSHELSSMEQLREVVESSFRRAYSPAGDERWQPKFNLWWRRFRSRTKEVQLERTYEATSAGTVVRGYAFSGFELTSPLSEPPPKGTPSLFQWALLIKTDGTIEQQPFKVIYASR